MEPTDVKVDKRTKEYKETVQGETKPEVDYSKAVNNPGFKLCSECGCDLPPNEDGTPKWRKYPEPCHDCIWKNYGRSI